MYQVSAVVRPPLQGSVEKPSPNRVRLARLSATSSRCVSFWDRLELHGAIGWRLLSRRSDIPIPLATCQVSVEAVSDLPRGLRLCQASKPSKVRRAGRRESSRLRADKPLPQSQLLN